MLLIVAVYVALIGVFIFTFFFADTDAPGVSGCLSRFIMKSIPRFLSKTAKTILGARIHGVITRAIDYIFYRRNPILQVQRAPVHACK